MTKKDQLQAELKEKIKAGIKPSQIKKSRSAEDLIPQPKDKQIQALKDQVKFESQKAQNYLEQITQLTAELDTKEQTLKELTETKNQLTDQNNELRLDKLKNDDYFTKYQTETKLTQQLQLQLAKLQTQFTKTQQDLKQAQRVIELRLNRPANKDNHQTSFDY